jgi:hypothetical protein
MLGKGKQESARGQAVTKVIGIPSALYNLCKNGNSLKKCDVPDSSYGKFEDTAGWSSCSSAGAQEKY